MRLLIRLRGFPARGARADPRGRRGALVARGGGRRLGAPRRPRERLGGVSRPPGRPRLLERRARLLRLERTTRLPTEAEWEYAAGAAAPAAAFPGARSSSRGGEHRMNVFQGTFPAREHLRRRLRRHRAGQRLPPKRPRAAQRDRQRLGVDRRPLRPQLLRREPARRPDPRRRGEGPVVMRGGSYLCHASYCNRYRVDARSPPPGWLDRQPRFPRRQRSDTNQYVHSPTHDVPLAELLGRVITAERVWEWTIRGRDEGAHTQGVDRLRRGGRCRGDAAPGNRRGGAGARRARARRT